MSDCSRLTLWTLPEAFFRDAVTICNLVSGGHVSCLTFISELGDSSSLRWLLAFCVRGFWVWLRMDFLDRFIFEDALFNPERHLLLRCKLVRAAIPNADWQNNKPTLTCLFRITPYSLSAPKGSSPMLPADITRLQSDRICRFYCIEWTLIVFSDQVLRDYLERTGS